ncbi:MAG: hypothetical protein EXS18_02125 [Verrucomicrobiae bacterium]|nr:hypothetical protein [Verrucomicrobiae bacterium]
MAASAGSCQNSTLNAYTYDLAGNRLALAHVVESTTNTTAYTYDDLNRLRTAVPNTPAGVPGTNTYLYDLNGNRTYKLFASVTNILLDTKTNIISGGVTNTVPTTITNTFAVVATNSYAYDVNNRLRSVLQDRVSFHIDYGLLLVTPTNEPVTAFEASYDYRTRRLLKTESTGAGLSSTNRTYFRYDGGDSFQEWSGTTNLALKVEFVRGSGLGGGIGSILYSDRSAASGPVEYFTCDALGSTVALTLYDGSVHATDLYEAFGNIASSTGSSDNNRLSHTKERDFNIGLDNHGERYFDPEIGRYISRDPIGYGDGMNVYLYVHNNPINQIDPQGLWAEDLVLGIPSLAIGSVSLWQNIKAGNVGAALLDTVGIVADAGAIALPGVPGGVGLGIKAGRAANAARKTIKAAQQADRVINTVQAGEGAIESAQEGDDLGVVRGTALSLLGTKSLTPGKPGKLGAVADEGQDAVNAAQKESKALVGKSGEGVKDASRSADELSKAGRTGKQEKLRELANDPNTSSADRGWIKNEERQIKTGNRDTIRNPPGKDLAHERGREAAKGYSYEHSNLQDRALHRTQHKFDDFGRANKERPITSQDK